MHLPTISPQMQPSDILPIISIAASPFCPLDLAPGVGRLSYPMVVIDFIMFLNITILSKPLKYSGGKLSKLWTQFEHGVGNTLP